MVKNIKELLEETEKLKKENAALQQQLREAKGSIDAIKTGNIDALVIADKKDLKVYTERTADKTYRILIEQMHEGAVTLNEDGTILYCNSYFSKMVNLPLQKVIGTKFRNFIDDLSKEVFDSLFKHGWKNAIREEIYIYTKDRKATPVRMSANPLSLDNNFMLSIILTDLTIENKNREELKRRATQLEQKNKELAFQNTEKEKREAELIIANTELLFQSEEKEKRASELIMANNELQSFTYVSSHDLQEPLRKIQTFISRINVDESSNLTGKSKDYFLRIQEAARRMQTLLIDLLSFSRVNSAARIFAVTNLNDIVEQVKSDLKEDIEEKHATIDDTELCEANIIVFQFHQLMCNLISNALKFSHPGIPPHIIIKSSIIKYSKLNNEHLIPGKQYCHITIKDNGIGFDPQFKDKIFDVFQKLHPKTEYAGTGIGLAIVKKIVENHNGVIIATSDLGKGARFDIYIPAE